MLNADDFRIPQVFYKGKMPASKANVIGNRGMSCQNRFTVQGEKAKAEGVLFENQSAVLLFKKGIIKGSGIDNIIQANSVLFLRAVREDIFSVIAARVDFIEGDPNTLMEEGFCEIIGKPEQNKVHSGGNSAFASGKLTQKESRLHFDMAEEIHFANTQAVCILAGYIMIFVGTPVGIIALN